jgi:hypothetical protein
MAFTEQDLLPDISQEELDGIAKELVTPGDPEPIETTITEQEQKVEDYTKRYDVPELRQFRLVRALVLYELYSRLGTIPQKRKDKYEEAMRELRDIRDGKFPDLALEDPPPDGLPEGQGRWGSDTRINT